MKKFLYLVQLCTILFAYTPIFAQDAYENESLEFASSNTLQDQLYANITYPLAARLAGVSGQILVSYTISPAGQILNLEASAQTPAANAIEVDETITIMGKGAKHPDPNLLAEGQFSLQAESLMALQRIRRLQPDTYEGRPVASAKLLLIHFILE